KGGALAPPAANAGGRLRQWPVYLEAERVAEEKPARPAGTELFVEREATVVPRVATDPADLDVAAMLRTEGRSPAGQQHRNNSERPHRRPPWGRVAGAPQNRKFSLNVRYLRNPTTRDEAWRTPGRVRRCWVAFP